MATISQAQADAMQEQVDAYEQQRVQFEASISSYQQGLADMGVQEELFASKRDALSALLADATIED